MSWRHGKLMILTLLIVWQHCISDDVKSGGGGKWGGGRGRSIVRRRQGGCNQQTRCDTSIMHNTYFKLRSAGLVTLLSNILSSMLQSMVCHRNLQRACLIHKDHVCKNFSWFELYRDYPDAVSFQSRVFSLTVPVV